MAVREEQLVAWAQSLSEAAEDKCHKALTQITEALRERFGYDIFIDRQGSHKNRTNIRLDSDLDILVVHKSYYFEDFSSLSSENKTVHIQNNKDQDAGYTFLQFRTDIEKVLKAKFGDSVESKSKCLRVIGNSYRVNADVVPTYVYRRYQSPNRLEVEGVGFKKDKGLGELVPSFPTQHYDNGVLKNKQTNESYKSVVRILKNIRNKLVENGQLEDESISSFFIECLVWNVPETFFQFDTYKEILESVTLKIWKDMQDQTIALNYAEVSDLRWLFRGNQKRTPKLAEDFIFDAYLYMSQ